MDGFNYHYYAGRKSDGGRETYASVIVSENNREIYAQLVIAERREAGADEVILYTQKDFAAEIKRLTNGRGVNVVYDSVGQTTFEKSLDCLKPRGYLALFGQSSEDRPIQNWSAPPYDLYARNHK